MARIVWKGAISFGLVHVPVVLHAGAKRADLDFDWIDRRDMASVGYSRVNKRTGKAIDFEHIVKGYEYEKGEYVLMSDEDFRRANPAATQTVEITCFVKASELAPYYFNTPYYLSPDKRGEKGYALLRETLRRAKRVGIANIVLHTKQHLAAVMVVDDVILLNTMRYADEIQSYEDLNLPSSNLPSLGISERECEMAMRLVDEMTEAWRPDRFSNAYRDDLLARIEEKIDSGQTHSLTEPDEDARPRRSAKVIDLMSMLQQSIESRAATKRAPAGASNHADDDQDADDQRKVAKKAPRKKASGAAGKTAGKTSPSKSTRGAAKKAASAKTARQSTTKATKRAPARKTTTQKRAA